MFLKIGTGSDKASPFIQPALAANIYAVSVIAAGTLLGTFQRAECLYITVLVDIIVITCAGETLAPVVCYQIMFGIATGTAGSGTVDDDEVDKSHFY